MVRQKEIRHSFSDLVYPRIDEVFKSFQTFCIEFYSKHIQKLRAGCVKLGVAND